MGVTKMSHLVKTTLDELAIMADELELDEKVIFSTEDPDELEYYNLQPCQYNLICKSKLLYENDYVIIIGLIDGNCTVAKDITILANGNTDDEDSRIEGIRDFLSEYYEKYMKKNKHNNVYLIVD
jgi:hypothetical protein